MCENIIAVNRSELNSDEIRELAALVNAAYLEGEKDICEPDLKRISQEELCQILEKGELITLRVNKIIKGCIHVCASPYDAQAALFGMLAVAPEPKYRGKGLGTELVLEAERYARSKGYKFLNLELLKPLDFFHNHKNRLQTWYEKLGYIYQRSQKFKSKELLIIRNYDFRIYKKQL